MPEPRTAAEILKVLTVDSPCSVPWASMNGTDRTRFCGQCRKHVHNLEFMTAQEAADLVQRPGGACIRFYRRADGTVATQDCAVEEAKAARLARRFAVFMASSMFLLFGVAMASSALHALDYCVHVPPTSSLRRVPGIGFLVELFDPTPALPSARSSGARIKIDPKKKMYTGIANYGT